MRLIAWTKGIVPASAPMSQGVTIRESEALKKTSADAEPECRGSHEQAKATRSGMTAPVATPAMKLAAEIQSAEPLQ